MNHIEEERQLRDRVAAFLKVEEEWPVWLLSGFARA